MKKLIEWFSWTKRLNNRSQRGIEMANKAMSASLIASARMRLSDLFFQLETSEKGIDQNTVQARLAKFGLNEVSHEKPPSWWALLLGNFSNPFVLLLIFLAVISLFLGDTDSVVIISCMVLLSVVMRFIQEYRSNAAAEKLKALVSTKATVLRLQKSNSLPKEEEIDIKYVVPGDVIHLSAGDLVPADVRLLFAKDLFISQAMLTGESMPAEKSDSIQGKEEVSNPIEMPNLCFMGTNVLNGSAKAIVLQTGNKTYFGSMAKSLTGWRAPTSFDIGINQVSWILIRFMLFVVPFVFLINSLTKGSWLEALLFSLSVAVGLTPEMLPMIVTANLARGAVNMSRSKVIVKRLNAIQNFGAMNILCTDKTGTLTQDRIILEKYLDVENEENEEVLKYGFLNSFYQTGLKNLLDVAVLNHRHLEDELDLKNNFNKVDEIPFDFNRRRMSVILQKNQSLHVLICKGAFDEVLAICNTFKKGDSVIPLTDEMRKNLKIIERDLNDDGLRVLAVAFKDIPNGSPKEYHCCDECDLIFLGYLAFLDPPKNTATEAIARLQEYNVKVKILTGDNEFVTQKICKWVSLTIDGILTGPQMDKMDDWELKKAVDGVTVFAKLTPLQKTRVVNALKENGHVVGYLGDGINDAPALRAADVGISVDTAVDIAKESADIIMLEKSLLFLGEGVLEGRRTFGNIIKYIKMAASSNFGNVFSIIGASAILPFLPMLPIQLLTQNLLYDFSQTAIPFDKVDREFLLQARKWDSRGIAKFMIFIGPISSLFDYVTFALLWFVFGANSIENQSIFQAGWFVEGLLSQTLIVHMIRTRHIPFIQSIASVPLLVTTAVVMAIGIYIPYSYIGHSIGLTSLPGNYFYWLIAILLSYCALTQAVKIWFIKRFNYWL